MMLGKEALIQHIKKGSIRIEPFLESSLRPASIVFTLSPKLLFLQSDGSFREENIGEQGRIVHPGEFVLGYTVEHLILGMNVCAIFNTRREYARLGLDALQTDTFAEPGTDNVIELPIRNGGPNPINLFIGMPIVKAMFQIVQNAVEL
ncbi:MAG: hypothetical protein AAB400_01860 [Patescibacteria group bacterium]